MASARRPGAYVCGTDAAMDVVGGKWKVLILWALNEHACRFGELRRLVPGITEKVLASHLRELELDGVVHREEYAELPPRVEYSLTPLGDSLNEALRPLGVWGRTHLLGDRAYPSADADRLIVLSVVREQGELTDHEWQLLAPLLPAPARAGGRWRDHRQVVDGVLLRTRTGIRWRDLPARFGPWRTVAARHRRWTADGTWAALPDALQTRLAAGVDARDEAVLRDLIGRLGEVARLAGSASSAA
ncbi:winged helix-turn-helix transcriptional regulator [Embleya sp. AB8]|uniref:winged helix-turn-helix transcriptional regulator n=1 Tax=Embleya sp. AB8 TaxID=3156304 RepID=UPI003C72F5BA